jgi:hypothetical protein
MKELERKNNDGVQPMTPRSRSNGFPHLEEELIGGDCRSGYPLSKP